MLLMDAHTTASVTCTLHTVRVAGVIVRLGRVTAGKVGHLSVVRLMVFWR